MSLHRLFLSTPLRAPAETVWAQISSMRGVNRELWPIVMTSPRGARIDAEAPLGRVAFRSVLLLGGVLPIDLHWLRLLQVQPGAHFEESSWSLSERRWIHRRWLRPEPEGCRIEDEVLFEPRFAGALLQPLVQATFRRRHRRLAQWFTARGATTFLFQPKFGGPQGHPHDESSR